MRDASPKVSWPWIAAFLLLIGAAYLPALQGEYLMTDQRAIVQNLHLLSLDGLRSLWIPLSTDPYAALDQYQPLTYTTFWIERQTFGLQPQFSQLIGIAFHAASALLVWRILKRIGVKGAPVAALLFALHPLNVESVVWIYERKNLVSGFFYFLSLLSFLHFEEDRKRAHYGLALGFFAAALLAKTSTVVLPVVIVLYWWFRGERPTRERTLEIAPFFALAVMAALVTIWHERSVTGASGELFSATLLERIVRAGSIAEFHALKMLIPAKLSFFYPLYPTDLSSFRSYMPDFVIGSGLIVLFLGSRKPAIRATLFATLYYLVSMAPVLGIFDIYYHQYSLLADHFQYLAILGPIALLVHAATTGLERALRRTPPTLGRFVRYSAAFLVIALFWILSWNRSVIFASNETLVRDAASKYPTAWLAQHESGQRLLQRAEREASQRQALLALALDHLQQAYEIRPSEPEGNNSLAVAYRKTGQLEEAERHQRLAVGARPENALYRKNLAGLLEARLGTPRALPEYAAMAEANPDWAEGWVILAAAYERANQPAKARDAAERALAILERGGHPPSPEIFMEARRLRSLR